MPFLVSLISERFAFREGVKNHRGVEGKPAGERKGVEGWVGRWERGGGGGGGGGTGGGGRGGGGKGLAEGKNISDSLIQVWRVLPIVKYCFKVVGGACVI